MKKYLLSVLFIILISHCFGQLMKFDAKRFSILSTNGVSNTNLKWIETGFPVDIDLTNNKITLYSKVEQIFNSSENIGTTDNTQSTKYTFICTDKKHRKCKISLILWKDKNEEYSSSLIVTYPQLQYVYDLKAKSVLQ